MTEQKLQELFEEWALIWGLSKAHFKKEGEDGFVFYSNYATQSYYEIWLGCYNTMKDIGEIGT